MPRKPLPIAEEDRRRFHESRHDLAAVEDPAPLVGVDADAAESGHVTVSHGRLSRARQTLFTAVQTLLREHGEDDQTRATLRQAQQDAAAMYDYTRGQVRSRLLSIHPSERRALRPEEVERRARAFTRLFGMASSALSREAVGRQLELLESVVQEMSADPALAALDLHGDLGASVAALVSARDANQRERGETGVAQQAVNTARVVFDRAHHAHRLLVESILVRQGREDQLGVYCLAQDAAYAARRLARRPLTEESDAEALDDELGLDLASAED